MQTHQHSNAQERTSEPRISVKIDRDFKSRIEAVERATGLNEATLTRQLWQALIDHVEATGAVTMPLQITSRPELEIVFQGDLPKEYPTLPSEQKQVVIRNLLHGRFKPRRKSEAGR